MNKSLLLQKNQKDLELQINIQQRAIAMAPQWHSSDKSQLKMSQYNNDLPNLSPKQQYSNRQFLSPQPKDFEKHRQMIQDIRDNTQSKLQEKQQQFETSKFERRNELMKNKQIISENIKQQTDKCKLRNFMLKSEKMNMLLDRFNGQVIMHATKQREAQKEEEVAKQQMEHIRKLEQVREQNAKKRLESWK